RAREFPSRSPPHLVYTTEKPNDRHRRLLRARRERPRDSRAAAQCDEFAPPHGTYPKAKDRRLTIAGLEQVGGLQRSKNRRPMSELGRERKSLACTLWSGNPSGADLRSRSA